MKILMAIILLVVVFMLPNSAIGRGGPQPQLSFVVSAHLTDDPVEQQSPNWYQNSCWNTVGPPCDPSLWVHNPTNCVWDVDDVANYIINNAGSGGATLGAGTSVSVNECLVVDGFNNWSFEPHPVQVDLFATKPGLTITATNDQGQTSSATVTIDQANHGYRYLLCTSDLTPGPYPTIPNSNGGVGIVTRWTITVRNSTNQDIKSIGGSVVLGNRFAATAPTRCPT